MNEDIQELVGYLSAVATVAVIDGAPEAKVSTLRDYLTSLDQLIQERTTLKGLLDEIGDSWDAPGTWDAFGEAAADVLVKYKQSGIK